MWNIVKTGSAGYATIRVSFTQHKHHSRPRIRSYKGITTRARPKIQQDRPHWYPEVQLQRTKPAPNATPRIATPTPITPPIPDPPPIMRLAVAAFFVWLAAGALLLGAGGALGTTEEDASVPDALPLLALAAASSEVVVVGRTVVVAPADVTVRELETLTVVRELWETPDDAEAAPEEVWWPLCLDESVELAELWSDADALPDAEDEAGLERVETPVTVGAAVAGPAWR